MSNPATSPYRCEGIDDSESHCSCCGKVGLKRVVWLREIDSNEDAKPYGTTCAVLLMTGQKVSPTRAATMCERAAAATLRADAEEAAKPIRWAMNGASVPAPARLRNGSTPGHSWWGADGVEIGVFDERFDGERHGVFHATWLRRKIAAPMIAALPERIRAEVQRMLG